MSSLHIKADGSAKYFTEGDPETYGGTVKAVGPDNGVYTLKTSALDNEGKPAGDRSLHLGLLLNRDEKVLNVTYGDPGDGNTKEFKPVKD